MPAATSSAGSALVALSAAIAIAADSGTCVDQLQTLQQSGREGCGGAGQEGAGGSGGPAVRACGKRRRGRRDGRAWDSLVAPQQESGRGAEQGRE